MIAEIASGLESLKVAYDAVKGAKAFADEATANMLKVELSRNILEAQAGLLAAQQQVMESNQRVAQLEAEVDRLKKWDEDRALYELADAGQGSLAYRKRGADENEPQPWFCPNCFDRGERSMLQPYLAAYSRTLHCPRCSADLNVQGTHRPTHAMGGRN